MTRASRVLFRCLDWSIGGGGGACELVVGLRLFACCEWDFFKVLYA